MSDLQEISQLFQGYATHFDARDAAAFADLFTDDAVVVTPVGKELSGRERIVAMVERTPPGGRHVIGAASGQVDGDTAAATATFEASLADGSAMKGRYDDQFRRTSDGWRISRHTIVIEPPAAG